MAATDTTDQPRSTTLRQAAARLRQPGPPATCVCSDDTDHWFDRSICPEPCDSMHNICAECGRIKGPCPVTEETRQPSAANLALADLFDAIAAPPGTHPAPVWGHALTLARTVLSG